MLNESRITAVVVLYHSKGLVKNLLTNLRQSISGLEEIILVDNSNEDLSEFEEGVVRVIQPEMNLGYGAAINLGVAAAKNNNIVAMNPDILIDAFDFDFAAPPSKLFILSGISDHKHKFPKFPTLSFDFIRIALCNLSKVFQPLRGLSRSIEFPGLNNYEQVDWICGCLIVTNKQTFKKLGGLDEDYFLFYEEVDLCRRSHILGIPVLATRLIRYRALDGKSSSIDVSYIKLKSEIISLQRYHIKYSNIIISKFTFILLKIWSLFVVAVTSISYILIKTKKIDNKRKQYNIYYTYLMNFRGLEK